MAGGVLHISDEEAARDLEALLEAVRSDSQVMIEAPGRRGVTMMVPDEPVKARSITAILEGLKQREEAQGLAMPDDEFAVDVAEARKRYNGPVDGLLVKRRTIAEAIEILRLRQEIQGLSVPDPDFASDMEEIHALYNEPMDVSKWD